MRNNSFSALTGNENQNLTGSFLPAGQIISASFLAYFGDAQGTGTFKLQASNDAPTDAPQATQGAYSPTNWADIPNQSASVTTGTSALLTLSVSAYRWIRAIWTATGTGTQTVAPIADTGVKQAQTITTVADVAGSLNNTYLLLSSVNTTSKAQKNFYIWFNINSAGTDPALAGKTAIPITGATNVSANTLATSIRSALNALTGDFVATGSNAAVIVTDVAFGPVTAAVDGAVPTGFTFGSATVGVASNLNNTYFLLQDEASVHKYYVWNNVDSIGTDPAVAGRTGVPIAFTSGASAGTIGTALASAIAALNSTNSFTAAGTTTVTVTNKATGPFTPMTDGTAPTGFTFAVTAGGNSTINVIANIVSI